ncbi:SDR family NAD(P)-dependent oxidoreductase [Primorskyibacter sp. S87]|uniref:SDR family NAD(P)-dependent oxidoreductase n=1 Tax=Primorskyibacter sp. S87 TaxID=3415126 RepID=UPI003C79BAA5
MHGPINVNRALIVGASGGIGAAVAETLEDKAVEVVRLSRSAGGFDLRDPESIDRSLTACHGLFDLIFVATGILAPKGFGPEKSLDQIDAAAMVEAMTVNAVGPALIMRHLPRLLPKTGRTVVAVLTARVGSIGDNRLGGWYSYRASKAAANQIVRTAAIEIGRKRKEAIIVALHPGTVATPFTSGFQGYRKSTPTEAAGNLLSVIGDLTPADTGSFRDWAGLEVPW